MTQDIRDDAAHGSCISILFSSVELTTRKYPQPSTNANLFLRKGFSGRTAGCSGHLMAHCVNRMGRANNSKRVVKTRTTIGGTIVASMMLMLLATDAIAGSTLSLARSSESEIRIQLQNDEPVAAMQFALHSSSNIELQAVSVSERMEGGLWTASVNRMDDSTMYVVLMRAGMENLAAGEGTIAILTLRIGGGPADPLRVSFDEVVASSPTATRVFVAAESLEWLADVPEFDLGQNYPNPFNPTTSIPYTLRTSARVSLSVYDMAGREIRKITEGTVPAGRYCSTWDGTDNAGVLVPSGVYFVRLRVADRANVRKMILAR